MDRFSTNFKEQSVRISVSDPGHFYTDPELDPTQNKNTDPDLIQIQSGTRYIHMLFKVLSDCSKVAIHD